jgi:3-phosphoshikimate 1-carboxyvinyltransferase
MNREVLPVNGFRGNIQVPPDKSIAHRMAMFAALAEGDSTISNFSLARDPQSTLSCLKALGVEVSGTGADIVIHGRGKYSLRPPSGPLDCGNSGTTMRLLAGILAGAGISTVMTGDASLSRRTMKRIVDPLQLMGANIRASEQFFPPLTLNGGASLKGIEYTLPIASAQVKSCILLAGLFAEGETLVIEPIPTRDHTERLLSLEVSRTGDARIIRSHSGISVPVQNGTVPGDFSAATFWMVAGSVVPNSDITLKNVGMNPTRTAALNVLRRMGAKIEMVQTYTINGEPAADLRITSAQLSSTEILPVEIPNLIDELPALGVAMRFAEGTSIFRNASELRHKECDRLSAMAAMLTASGCKVKEFEDGLAITGNPDNRNFKTTFQTNLDHRIVMSAAILAAASNHTNTVCDADDAAVSYPTFWSDFDSLTAS